MRQTASLHDLPHGGERASQETVQSCTSPSRTVISEKHSDERKENLEKMEGGA